MAIFFAFTKNKCIGDTGTICLVTNNDDDMFDIKIINKTVQQSSGTMKAIKLGKKKVQIK